MGGDDSTFKTYPDSNFSPPPELPPWAKPPSSPTWIMRLASSLASLFPPLLP